MGLLLFRGLFSVLAYKAATGIEPTWLGGIVAYFLVCFAFESVFR